MEKKKRNKWIIALAILTLIAVAVVCIVLFIPKNTDNVVSQTKAQAETMFLQNDDDIKMYSSLQTKVSAHANKYLNEVNSAKSISESLTSMIQFYSVQLVYAENNSTFQAYYNQILDGYNMANSYQNQMLEIITEVYEKINLSSTFTEGAWINFKTAFSGYVKGYAKALQGLSQVFIDCVPDGVLHNDLTFLVLNTVNDYVEVISDKGIENRYIVNSATAFVNRYINSGTSPIFKYKYNSNLQEKVKLMGEFKTVYNNQTIKNVIESIESSGIKYEGVEADTKGILTQVKTFLNGGLSA